MAVVTYKDLAIFTVCDLNLRGVVQQVHSAQKAGQLHVASLQSLSLPTGRIPTARKATDICNRLFLRAVCQALQHKALPARFTNYYSCRTFERRNASFAEVLPVQTAGFLSQGLPTYTGEFEVRHSALASTRTDQQTFTRNAESLGSSILAD